MILSYRQVNELMLPVVIEGIVVGEKNNECLCGTHVCLENSEEEVVTNKRGEFRITCWQGFPVALTFKQLQFRTVRVVITGTRAKMLVYMQKE